MSVLYCEFAETIPLHQAVRAASTRRDATLAEYRWFALARHLQTLNVSFDPPTPRKKPAPSSTVVTPRTRACPECGVAFFADKERRYCSPQCWGLIGVRARQRKRQAA